MGKSTSTELQAKLASANARVVVGTRWLHKKGGQYQVVGHDIDAEDGELRVRYCRVGGPGFDARAEKGITFSRRYEEWSLDRFAPMT